MEVFVQHFDEIVDRLQVAQVVVVDVDADAEVETGVPAVHDFEVTELLKKVQYNCESKFSIRNYKLIVDNANVIFQIELSY